MAPHIEQGARGVRRHKGRLLWRTASRRASGRRGSPHPRGRRTWQPRSLSGRHSQNGDPGGGSNSIRMSVSLSGRSSPRAREPNSAACATPLLRKSASLSRSRASAGAPTRRGRDHAHRLQTPRYCYPPPALHRVLNRLGFAGIQPKSALRRLRLGNGALIPNSFRAARVSKRSFAPKNR